MPPKFSKIEALNYGLQIGQMEVVLTVFVQKVSLHEVLCNKGKELLPLLEMLKMSFRAKCLKRSANFDEEISKLHSLDKKLLALLEEMKELNIKFFE